MEPDKEAYKVLETVRFFIIHAFAIASKDLHLLDHELTIRLFKLRLRSICMLAKTAVGEKSRQQ